MSANQSPLPVDPREFLSAGQHFHGHKCPAMPLGLRVGAEAMNTLGVGRARDGQLLALLELGDDHCATCFADGIQVVTGCTFGKGNIKKLHHGKWGLTLVDVKSARSVRVAPLAEAMLANKQTDFFKKYREKGIPASEVAPYDVAPKPHSFASFVCDRCGEMTVEGYGRPLGDRTVCQPCFDSAFLAGE